MFMPNDYTMASTPRKWLHSTKSSTKCPKLTTRSPSSLNGLAAYTPTQRSCTFATSSNTQVTSRSGDFWIPSIRYTHRLLVSGSRTTSSVTPDPWRGQGADSSPPTGPWQPCSDVFCHCRTQFPFWSICAVCRRGYWGRISSRLDRICVAIAHWKPPGLSWRTSTERCGRG